MAIADSYATGAGVLKDKVLAHMWLNIASSKGIAHSSEMRDKLEKSMSPADISEATKKAKRCLKSRYKYCD